MTVKNELFESQANSVTPASSRAATTWHGWAGRLLRELALHDWIVLVYLTILVLAVWGSADSEIRTRCLGHVGSMLGFCVSVLLLVRGGLVRDRFLAPLAYRVAVYGTVQISYFELRE